MSAASGYPIFLLLLPTVVQAVRETMLRPIGTERLGHHLVDEPPEMAFRALYPIVRLVGASESRFLLFISGGRYWRLIDYDERGRFMTQAVSSAWAGERGGKPWI